MQCIYYDEYLLRISLSLVDIRAHRLGDKQATADEDGESKSRRDVGGPYLGTARPSVPSELPKSVTLITSQKTILPMVSYLPMHSQCKTYPG